MDISASPVLLPCPSFLVYSCPLTNFSKSWNFAFLKFKVLTSFFSWPIVGTESPPNMPHLHRCPYTTGMRPWNLGKWEWRFFWDGGAAYSRAAYPYTMTSSIKQKRRVAVTGNSLLRGMEGPVCWPDPTHKEVLPPWGPHKRQHQETCQPGMAHWLSVSVGFSDRQQWNPIKKAAEWRRTSGPWDNWSRDLEYKLYFVLPVAGNDGVRNRKIMQNNTWLRDWCDQQDFGVFDHRSVFTTPSLLATNKKGS